MNDDHRDHGHGLAEDLKRLAKATNRRQMLRLLAGASLVPLFGCGGSNSSPASATGGGAGAGTGGGAGAGTGGGAGAGTGTCTDIPDETGGPYPGDGTNGVNALTESGIMRSDIRSSFGSLSGNADGIITTLEIKLVNINANCAPLEGYAIYLWHCDRDGSYSLYTEANQNYLRGVQETDSDGTVTFTTIFPGCYSGRWPHVHFEIFSSLAEATNGGNSVKVSQLALPEDACDVAYAASGYESSVSNLAQTSLSQDNVFSDGSTAQLATVTGDASSGFVVSLTVGIAV